MQTATHNNKSVEILAVRQSMWEKVEQRAHKPLKVFPYGSGSSDEAMLFGTVMYLLKTGEKEVAEWSAYAHFTKDHDGDGLKLDFYQVYIVSLPIIFSGPYVGLSDLPDFKR